jgi:two-component system sensor histidine kinase KdpD
MHNKPANKTFLELVQNSKNGKLKIYIGSTAGVGKSYRMLQEAHELRAQGVDVVIAYVETHGRQDTANLLPGLEIIPTKKHQYQGIIIEEMDLEGVIARKPEVAIVDEVAHTNLPDCSNTKRFQDILELLSHGINIICAFNIQHLDSLNDIILNAIGIKVFETVPDSFLQQANQIVNIDLSVEDLLHRLESGKIYDLAQKDTAMQNFFKPENILRLRELALREVAESLDRGTQILQQAERSKPSKKDKLMVLFQPAKYSQKGILRKASRLAGKLNTDWIVAYVELPSDAPEVIDLEIQSNLYADMQTASELGANFIHLKGQSRIEKWLECAEKEMVSHLVVGQAHENWWDYLLGRTLLQALHKYAKGYDIYILSSASSSLHSGG